MTPFGVICFTALGWSAECFAVGQLVVFVLAARELVARLASKSRGRVPLSAQV
jgi:hypothetical protein